MCTEVEFTSFLSGKFDKATTVLLQTVIRATIRTINCKSALLNRPARPAYWCYYLTETCYCLKLYTIPNPPDRKLGKPNTVHCVLMILDTPPCGHDKLNSHLF